MGISAAGSSSDVAPASQGEYDVFLNFRGEDTRRGFTDFLYHNLNAAGVHVFRDEEKLPIGEVISEKLKQAIKNTIIYIPIFSETYASSKWCLRELKLMIDNVSESEDKKSIIPIFFHVECDDVKLKKPLYEADLKKHEEDFCDEVEGWKGALVKVTEHKGWVVTKDQSQAEIVKSVVKKVLEKLEIKQKVLTEQPVGLNDRVNGLKLLLDANDLDVRLILIYGMGGIGKTTIAKVVFNEISSNFGKRCSFLEGVRKSSSTEEGLVKMQQKLLREIFDSERADDVKDSEQGLQRIVKTLPTDTVLVVLDDVDDKENIKKLIGKSSLKPGSRIMITTRNKDLLQVEDFEGKIQWYEMQELDNTLALQLFHRHAFGKDSPSYDYHRLSSKIVSHMGGLPLAIQVIGSLLKGKDEKCWIETLAKLGKVPEKQIMETLRISYDDLESHHKQIFLDIACFFVNEKKTDAIYMWDDCNFFPEMGIEVLISRCLIKILDNGKFWMHDQLIDLGRGIVHQESPRDHAKRSRLWIAREAIEIIGTGEWKDKVEALEIDGWDHSIKITNEQMKNLPKLRYLKLDNGTYVGDFANCFSNLRYLKLDSGTYVGDFANCFSNLKWVFWCSSQQNFRAKNMYLDHLVVFKLDKNDFKDDSKAWDLIKRARNLKVVSLTRCDGITTVPDFSKSTCLERLTLARCNRLKRIESFIGRLQLLTELNIEGCMSLIDLSKEVGALRKLTRFSLQGCCMLSKLPGSLENLTSLIELDLSSTSTTGCNLSWIARLSGLKELDINSPNMPTLQELAFLSHLEKLTVSEQYVKFLKLPPSLTYLQIKKFTSLGGLIHPSFKTKTEGREKATASRESIRESEESYSREKEKKVVFKVDLHDAKDRQKAVELVAGYAGVNSVSFDMTGKKMTVTGDTDGVAIVNRLRKLFISDIISIGSVEEREVGLKVGWHDEKDMQKAVDTIFGSAEVDKVVINMKDQKLRVTGTIDARKLVEKLREEEFSVELQN